MKVLVSPQVRDKIEYLKRELRQFEITELEIFLMHIESNPQFGAEDKETNLKQRILENDYFICIMIYEHIDKKDRVMFVSLELIKK